MILSIRPDNLSYVVQIADRQFLRPRRLLRPLTSDDRPTSSSSISAPVIPRRSVRLQSRASTSTINTYPNCASPPSTTSSTPSCHPSSSAWDKTPLTESTERRSSASISNSLVSHPPLPVSPLAVRLQTRSLSQTKPTYPSTPLPNPPMKRPPLTSPSMESLLLTSIGPVSQRASPPSWPWLSSASSSPDVVIFGGGASGSPGPGIRNSSGPSPPVAIPAPRSRLSPVLIPALPTTMSSVQTPSSSNLPLSNRSSTPLSAGHQASQLSNFPPLPPPAACQVAPPSTSTNINTPRRPLLRPPSSPLPTTQGTRGPSTILKADQQASTLSLPSNSASRYAPRPVRSVSAYNRSGIKACDLRSGSVARMTVRF